MKRQIIDSILDSLLVLVGQPLLSMTRGEGAFHVGIVSLKFGSDCTIDAMCSVRLIYDNEIIFTNEDIFHPSSKMEEKLTKNETFEWDEFDYNPYGNNFFDEMTSKLFNKEMNFPIVENIKISRFGDLTIILDNGLTFQFFADGSGYSENWRYHEANSSKPLIVTSKGIIDETP